MELLHDVNGYTEIRQGHCQKHWSGIIPQSQSGNGKTPNKEVNSDGHMTISASRQAANTKHAYMAQGSSHQNIILRFKRSRSVWAIDQLKQIDFNISGNCGQRQVIGLQAEGILYFIADGIQLKERIGNQ